MLRQISRDAFLYFTIIFALGFFLGTLRVLILSPIFGEESAVMLEIPIILAVAWYIAYRINKANNTHKTFAGQLLMGVFAFSMLMIAEFSLGFFMFDYNFHDQIRSYEAPIKMTGLGAQIVFALFPAVQFWLYSKKRP